MKRAIFFSLFSMDEFQALREGNLENLKKLYLHYKETLLHFLLIHLDGNRTIADDILQETFETIIQTPSKLKSQNNLKSWLLSIAYRRLLLFFRRSEYDRKKIRMLINEQILIENEPYELLEKKEKGFLITLALDKIRPQYKTIFEMKYTKGFSQKEIADSLQKTEGAVEQLLIRAKKAIRNELSVLHDNYFQKGGDIE